MLNLTQFRVPFDHRVYSPRIYNYMYSVYFSILICFGGKYITHQLVTLAYYLVLAAPVTT